MPKPTTVCEKNAIMTVIGRLTIVSDRTGKMKPHASVGTPRTNQENTLINEIQKKANIS